jgi:heptosyltransferase-2
VPLLRANPLIHRVVAADAFETARADGESWALLLSLDEDPAAVRLADLAPAAVKRGYGRNSAGELAARNPASEYAVRLTRDDDLKFRRNAKTYPEIVFEMAELEWRHDPYVLVPDPEACRDARRWLAARGAGEDTCVVGFSPGVGARWPSKAWPPERYVELADRLAERSEVRVLLLGGARERETNRSIAARARGRVLVRDTTGDLDALSGLVGACRAVVSSDSLCMHVGIALARHVVALFGPTCPQEIDLYGRGVRVVSPCDCGPCYRATCEKRAACMAAIPVERVLDALLPALE